MFLLIWLFSWQSGSRVFGLPGKHDPYLQYPTSACLHLKENLCRQWQPHWWKTSHFGTEYRKNPLPADKQGPVREIQYPEREKKQVSKRLEYQAQTSKSARHRNCRAKLRVWYTTRPGHCQPQYEQSASPIELGLPCYSTNTITQCKPTTRKSTLQVL
jgi:hypothetical protein